MKRKFLEDMGLEKEAIDKIMAEHGKAVEAAKGNTEQIQSELEQTRTHLQEANATIEGFRDYDQVKGQVEEYKTKLQEAEAQHAQEEAEREFQSVIKKAIEDAGGIDDVSIKANLDIKALMESKDQSKDILSAVEKVKTEKGHLFGAVEPITVAVTKTGGTKLTDITPEAFKKMGYKERIELKNSNPQKYEEMRGK